MHCNRCGNQISSQAKFCVSCGASVGPSSSTSSAATSACATCQAPLSAGQRFCTRCGAAVGAAPPAAGENATWTGGREGFFRRIVRRAPLMLMTFVSCAATHFYMMGMINGGYERSDSSFNKPRFVIPMVKDVQDESAKSALLWVQNAIAPAIEPLLPWGRYLMNWKPDYQWNGSSINFADRIDIDPVTRERRIVAGASHNVPPLPVRIEKSFTIGNFNNSFSLWTMLSLLFWTAIGTWVRVGPIRGSYQILAQPFRFLGCFLQKRLKDWGALLVGISLGALGISCLGVAPETTFMTAVGGMFLAPTPLGNRLASILFTIIPGPFKGRRSRSRFSLRSAQLLVTGLPAGAGFQSWLTSHPELLWGMLIVGGFLLLSGTVRRWLALLRVRRFVLLFSLLLLVYLGLGDWVDTLWADDGGRSEFGNATFPEWVMSSGGVEVGIHSVTGTLGTALGPLASSIQGSEPLPEEAEQENQVTSIRVTVSEATFDS